MKDKDAFAIKLFEVIQISKYQQHFPAEMIKKKKESVDEGSAFGVFEIDLSKLLII